MKKLIISLTALAGIIYYTACSPKKPAVFEQATGVYLNTASDSLIYSFAKYPHRTIDTLRIPVKLLGDAATTDRTINIQLANEPNLTAIEGVHFKLLPPFIMPAGQFATTIPIVIYRTKDLDSTPVTFKLQLQANEDFEIGIPKKTTCLVKLGYLQKPASWGETGGSQYAGFSGNYGTWTKTKYKLILDALYDPVYDTTVSDFPYLRTGFPLVYNQYMQIVKNYIRTNYPGNISTPVGVGAMLLDPDAGNKPVQVGPSNY